MKSLSGMLLLILALLYASAENDPLGPNDLVKVKQHFGTYVQKYKHYGSANARRMRVKFFKKTNYVNSDYTDKELPVTSEKGPTYDLNRAEKYFASYLLKYNKHYASPGEEEVRFLNFYKILKLINNINSDPKKTWAVDLNEFSDWTEEELKDFNDLKMPKKLRKPIYNLNKAKEYFEDFIKLHHRHYFNRAEKAMRLRIFYNVLKLINSINTDPEGTEVADLHAFSDRTDDELNLLTGLKDAGRMGNLYIGNPYYDLNKAVHIIEMYKSMFNKNYISTDEEKKRFLMFHDRLMDDENYDENDSIPNAMGPPYFSENSDGMQDDLDPYLEVMR